MSGPNNVSAARPANSVQNSGKPTAAIPGPFMSAIAKVGVRPFPQPSNVALGIAAANNAARS